MSALCQKQTYATQQRRRPRSHKQTCALREPSPAPS